MPGGPAERDHVLGLVAAEVGLVHPVGALVRRAAGVETYLVLDAAPDAGGRGWVLRRAQRPHLDPGEQGRLEREIRALVGSERAAGTDDEWLWVLRPFVAGQTLTERLATGPLGVDETIAIAVDVLADLEPAHLRSIIHRDVKPSNVILTPGGARLVDFCLYRPAWLQPETRDAAVVAARYVSPEIAGSIDAPIDARSDLYSLGVVLFECLAGRQPFDGASLGEVLRQHLTGPVPDLREIGVSVPRALAGLVGRLLEPEPEARYQSATAVRADLGSIAAARDAGISDPDVAIGGLDHRRTLADPAFVGRDTELTLLVRLVDDAHRGRGGLVTLEGESGGGKSRLLDELAREAAAIGAWVLRATAVDQVGHRPFQLFDSVAAAVAERAAADDAFAAHLRDALGDDAPSIVAVLPHLVGVFGATEVAEVPEQFGEQRSLRALVRLLAALGTPRRPVVVLLDDCQWEEGLSSQVLALWGQVCAPDERPALLVAAFRSDEVAATSPLRALPVTLSIRLGPLGDDHVHGVITSMVGECPSEIVNAVVPMAEGSPFMAEAIIRGLVECGGLVGTDRGWEVNARELAEAQTSGQAADFLVRRIGRMSGPALQLLGAAAVLGKQFSLELAVRLSELSPTDAIAARQACHARNILWFDEPGGAARFPHDKLREAVLERMDPEVRAGLHRRAAEMLQRTHQATVFDLAYHFDAAHCPAEALPYALSAAEQSRAQHALEGAESYYDIAWRAAAESPLDLRLRIAEGLADVLTLRGRYREAEEHLDAALALTTDGRQRAVFVGKQGEIAFRRGDHARACRDIEQALRSAGRWVPRHMIGYVLSLLWELAVQVAHCVLPRRWVARRAGEPDGDTRFALRLYSRLAYAYWFRSGRVPCGWTHFHELNLAERFPASLELAQAYSEHAPVMTMLPWYRRGITYALRSLAIRRERGDLWGEGQSLSFYGVVLYAASRYEDCIEAVTQAIDILGRTGDQWELNTATWHLAFAHYRLGHLDQAAAISEKLHHDASAIGDDISAGVALSSWARATGGQVPAQLIADAMAREWDDIHTGTEVRLAAAVCLLADGKPRAAADLLRSAWKTVRAAGLRQEYVAPVLPWLATCLRTEFESLGPDDPARTRVRREALRVARRAARLARAYANNQPHALRELALAEAARGRVRAARRLLRASVRVAEAQGATHERTESRAAQGRLGQPLGWPEAADDHRRGGEAERSATPGLAGTLSLADRFEGLIETGRAIAAATTFAAVSEETARAATVLLRSDGCGVVEITGAPVAEVDPAVDRVIDRAVAAGHAISWTRPEGESGPASILCAPIVVGGRAVACLWTSHDEIRGLFAGEEEQLANFITTLAGAALDHAADSQAHFRALDAEVQRVTAQFQVAFESAPIGMALTSVRPEAAGQFLRVNQALAHMLGYSRSQLEGRNIRELTHPEDQGADHMALERLAAGQSTTFEVDKRYRHADGQWVWVHLKTGVVVGADGEPDFTISQMVDITEQRAAGERLTYQALHDPLTGLPNRRLLHERLDDALARGNRHQCPVAVLYLDLDRFKMVNDSFGHEAGDRVLVEITERLAQLLRTTDTLARIGGDEFVLLCEDVTDEHALIELVNRIQASMEKPIPLERGGEVAIATSIGIAVSQPGQDRETLLRDADTALYSAKEQGRSRSAIFNDRLRLRVVDRMQAEQRLRDAIAANRLEVHYQPITDLDTGLVVSAETLLRYRDRAGRLIEPAGFVDVAEETGLIVPVGAWILRRACEQLAEWRADRRMSRFGLSVNVSPRQLVGTDFVDVVSQVLAETGLPAEALALEVTEGTFLEVDDSRSTLGRLKDLGCRVGIDDFGTGYSCLAYLAELPIDFIKIDQSFVARLDRDPSQAAVLGSIVGLTHALNLRAIAEGVETAAQRESLRALGCRFAQGYALGRPEEARTFARLHLGSAELADLVG